VLHIFSPAQKSTYETKRKNYTLLLRSKLKITKIEHNCNSSTKHSYNSMCMLRQLICTYISSSPIAPVLLHVFILFVYVMLLLFLFHDCTVFELYFFGIVFIVFDIIYLLTRKEINKIEHWGLSALFRKSFLFFWKVFSNVRCVCTQWIILYFLYTNYLICENYPWNYSTLFFGHNLSVWKILHWSIFEQY